MGDKWDVALIFTVGAVSVLLNWTSIDSTGVDNNHHFNVGTFQWDLAGRSGTFSPSWAGSSPWSATSGPETQEDSGVLTSRNSSIRGKQMWKKVIKTQHLNEIWKHISSSLDRFHSFSELSELRACVSRIVYMLHAHVSAGSPGTITRVQSDAGTLPLICITVRRRLESTRLCFYSFEVF